LYLQFRHGNTKTLRKRIRGREMIDHSEQRILMGNEAIGRGLV